MQQCVTLLAAACICVPDTFRIKAGLCAARVLGGSSIVVQSLRVVSVDVTTFDPTRSLCFIARHT